MTKQWPTHPKTHTHTHPIPICELHLLVQIHLRLHVLLQTPILPYWQKSVGAGVNQNTIMPGTSRHWTNMPVEPLGWSCLPVLLDCLALASAHGYAIRSCAETCHHSWFYDVYILSVDQCLSICWSYANTFAVGSWPIVSVVAITKQYIVLGYSHQLTSNSRVNH